MPRRCSGCIPAGGAEIIAEQVHVLGSPQASSDAAQTAGAEAPFAPHPASASNGAFSRGAPAAGATDIPF